MSNTRTFVRSFAGGEISPEMFGRIDDAKFQAGAAVMLNFIATPQGPARNRPGFQFVSMTKANGKARLIAFIYNNTQTMVLELGDKYIRFHTQGQNLLYATPQRPFVAPTTVTFTTTPTIVTWPSHQLQMGDLVQFQATVGGVLPTGIVAGTNYTVVVIDNSTFRITNAAGFPVNATTTGTAPITGALAYALGQLVSFAGATYYFLATTKAPIFVLSPPSADWYTLPSNLLYEIPTPFAAADLFDIHYVQSADVMTLVHPNYPPQELRRLGPTFWTMSAINFGAQVATPLGVTATPSPGYLARISSISTASPAVITTSSSHTLSLGDGIYINGLIATIGGTPVNLSGFYLVNLVPVDASGNLIPNQLQVMDYSGNTLNSSGWSGYSLSPGTIQYGTKIFNINSYYAVAALDANGANQSLLSATVTALNNLNVPGSYNVISWTAVPGSSLYYVFKQKNGLWGFIGEAMGTTFTDNNIAVDFSITPTNLETPFTGVNNYPAAVGYIEQRRCFAGTNNKPQTIEMSNSGTESTFSYSLPAQDTDRISIKIAAREVSSIEHIVPLVQLILLTGSCEYAEYTTNDAPVTPSTIGIRPQSYIGASNVQPTVVNNSLVYCAARGGHVREMGYNLQSNGFLTGDLSLRSAHLFDNLTIADQASAKSPIPIVWFVSSNGQLLGLTYVPEQQIGAWHHHQTKGTFESVCAVAEGNEDRLYAVINRTINGATVRYVERMASRLVGQLADCFFVDAGQTYSGAPASTISGLTWLEGQTVSILADGKVQNPKVVTGGAITLDVPASKVQVGLAYVSDLQTLPVSMQVDGFGQGRKKNINKVWIKIFQSSGILAGKDANSLTAYRPPITVAPGSLETDDAEIVVTGGWNDGGQLLVRQVNPLPLTVVDCTIEVAIGG